MYVINCVFVLIVFVVVLAFRIKINIMDTIISFMFFFIFSGGVIDVV